MLTDSSSEVLGSSAIRESLRLQNLRQHELLVKNNSHLDFELSYTLDGLRVKSARLQKRKQELAKILERTGTQTDRTAHQQQTSPAELPLDDAPDSVASHHTVIRPETAPTGRTRDKESHEMSDKSKPDNKKAEIARKFSLLMAKASNIPHMQRAPVSENEKDGDKTQRKSAGQSWGNDAKSFWKVPGLQARYVAAPPDFQRRFKSDGTSTKLTGSDVTRSLNREESREADLLNLLLQSSQSIQTLPLKRSVQPLRTRKHSTVYCPVIRDDDYVTLYSGGDISKTLEMPPMLLPPIDARKAFLIECNMSKKPQLRTLTDQDWAELRKCRYIRRGSRRFETPPAESSEESDQTDAVSM